MTCAAPPAVTIGPPFGKRAREIGHDLHFVLCEHGHAFGRLTYARCQHCHSQLERPLGAFSAGDNFMAISITGCVADRSGRAANCPFDPFASLLPFLNCPPFTASRPR